MPSDRAAAGAICARADAELAARPRPDGADRRALARFLADGLGIAETDCVSRLERLAPPPELRDDVAAAPALVPGTRSEVALLRAGADPEALLARSPVRALSLRETRASPRLDVPACGSGPARAGGRGEPI
jgi:hypothetical protein